MSIQTVVARVCIVIEHHTSHW